MVDAKIGADEDFLDDNRSTIRSSFSVEGLVFELETFIFLIEILIKCEG